MAMMMMWTDDDGKTSQEERIRKAVNYYKGKHGRQATKVLVHPTWFPVAVEGLEIVPDAMLLRNDIWVTDEVAHV